MTGVSGAPLLVSGCTVTAGSTRTALGPECGLQVVALVDLICVHEHIDRDGPVCSVHRAAELYCPECWGHHACPVQPFNIRDIAG